MEELSERELEVATLVAEVKTNKEIAALLCIAVSTVESHVHNILHKLGLKKRGQMTIWLLRRNSAIPNDGDMYPSPAPSRKGKRKKKAKNP